MNDCLFCKMVNQEIPADIVYEDEHVLAFNDINPQAPTHILIIPKQHISTTNDVSEAQEWLVGRMTRTAAKIAKDNGYADDGYRLVMNCNKDGQQTVFHIHMHLIAERSMTWPPG